MRDNSLKTSSSAKCMFSYASSWPLNDFCTPLQSSWLLENFQHQVQTQSTTFASCSKPWANLSEKRDVHQPVRALGLLSYCCKNDIGTICKLAISFFDLVYQNNLLDHCLFSGILHPLNLQSATNCSRSLCLSILMANSRTALSSSSTIVKSAQVRSSNSF